MYYELGRCKDDLDSDRVLSDVIITVITKDLRVCVCVAFNQLSDLSCLLFKMQCLIRHTRAHGERVFNPIHGQHGCTRQELYRSQWNQS